MTGVKLVNHMEERSNLNRALRNRNVQMGGVIIMILIAVAIFAPLLAPYDPAKIALGKRLSAPSVAFLFGTDEFGRDILVGWSLELD